MCMYVYTLVYIDKPQVPGGFVRIVVLVCVRYALLCTHMCRSVCPSMPAYGSVRYGWVCPGMYLEDMSVLCAYIHPCVIRTYGMYGSKVPVLMTTLPCPICDGLIWINRCQTDIPDAR